MCEASMPINPRNETNLGDFTSKMKGVVLIHLGLFSFRSGCPHNTEIDRAFAVSPSCSFVVQHLSTSRPTPAVIKDLFIFTST